jgi:Uma2 family endonuclease
VLFDTALVVPEVWCYGDSKLKINILQRGKYVKSKISQIFPDLPISEVIPQFIEESKIIGRGLTLKKFREWLEKQTNSGV